MDLLKKQNQKSVLEVFFGGGGKNGVGEPFLLYSVALTK